MRYSVQIDRAISSLMALRMDGVRKAGSTYRIVRTGDTVKLYHYSVCLGGVRLVWSETPIAILGSVVSRGDRMALNTLYNHFGVPRRVRLLHGSLVIDRLQTETPEKTPSNSR